MELFITDWQKEDSGTGKTTSTEARRAAERSASRGPPPRTPPPGCAAPPVTRSPWALFFPALEGG